jgi:hypothetical protein
MCVVLRESVKIYARMVIVVLSLINCLWKNLHLIPIFINFDVPEDILLLILSRRTKEAGTDIRKRFGINIGV